ncbi:MAG: peroxiredoxin [Anaerolineae bacterium]|nr:peroxiredoxin [Anaerolineae bacterium]
MVNHVRAGEAPRAQGKVQVGDQAPDFTLRDQANKPVQLQSLLGKGAVVLFFYPKDFSAGCTAEACSFRDSYEAFQQAGATVVGISADSTESHQGFAQRHRLPYILLSDPNGEVAKLYGVSNVFGILRGRATYIIDQHGVVRHIFSSQLNIDKHITEALRIVQAIQNDAA